MQHFCLKPIIGFLQINTGYRKILSTVQYRIPFPTTTIQYSQARELNNAFGEILNNADKICLLEYNSKLTIVVQPKINFKMKFWDQFILGFLYNLISS